MTISNDATSPLIVVVGATGTQGGSVVDEISASEKPYRIRGLTRDVSKSSSQELAKRNVEMVSCSLSVGNEAEVKNAFEGATYIFAVTNFWEHHDKAREIAEGKVMVDAAKAIGVKLFILSSEPSASKLSNGTINNVSHFESKAEISDYTRSSGIPFVEIHVAGYMNNFTTFTKPRPGEDGSFAVTGTWNAGCNMPLIDTRHDTGIFVRLAIESEEFNKGDGKIIGAYGDWVTVSDQVKILSEVSGKKVTYIQVTDEQLSAGLRYGGFPDPVIEEMLDMFRFHEQCWEKGYIHSNRENLPRRPRTFREYCETVDWKKVLG